MTAASPILWQTHDQTVTLIDLPRSIAAAQGTAASPCHDMLQSSEPLKAPFPTNEPKTPAAKAKLEANMLDKAVHRKYRAILHQALGEIRQNHRGDWCYPRPFVEDKLQAGTKRRFMDEPKIGANKLNFPATDDGTSGKMEALTSFGKMVSNDNVAPLHFRFSGGDSQPQDFLIPPKSSFFLGDCLDAHALHAAIRQQARDHGTPNAFNLVILDPPWPNRSVKRSHKTAGSTYSTSPSLANIRELLLDINLDLVMSDECLVAIWITNKSAIRDLVLGEEGIFAFWNVALIEEWLWLKTSAHGEPMTALDSLWRKPYEVLLVGKKHASNDGKVARSQTNPSREDVKSRVVISVPDLHSRKPCLKELIEPLLPDCKNYRALEVFARHLVSGWWSWGDECIKFNWEGFWKNVS